MPDGHSNRRQRHVKPFGGNWRVQIPVDQLEVVVKEIPPRLLVMMLILEGFARAKPYCYPSNKTLASVLGKSERQVKDMLSELEQRGWIERQVVTTGETRRDGIVMLRRLTVDDTPRPTSVGHSSMNKGGEEILPRWGEDFLPLNNDEENKALDGADASVEDRESQAPSSGRKTASGRKKRGSEAARRIMVNRLSEVARQVADRAESDRNDEGDKPCRR